MRQHGAIVCGNGAANSELLGAFQFVPPPGGGAHEAEAPVDLLEQAGRRRAVLGVEPSGTDEQRHDQQRAPGYPPQSHAGHVARPIPSRYPRKSKFFWRCAPGIDYIFATLRTFSACPREQVPCDEHPLLEAFRQTAPIARIPGSFVFNQGFGSEPSGGLRGRRSSGLIRPPETAES